jgi:hypothetical protein
MNFTKTIFALAIGSVGIMGAMSASAATLNSGDTLSITAGVTGLNSSSVAVVKSGSWCAMDTDGSGTIAGTEKVPLSQGTTGLIIGTTTSAGASHSGIPVAGDTNAIDNPWAFFGNTGSDYLTAAITGGTSGMNMSGWTAISLGTASTIRVFTTWITMQQCRWAMLPALVV